MYNTFFGFDENPFSITPDTLFFCNQQSHKDALNTMLVALKHCEGFIKIVGEVGTGKTLLCRVLLSHLSKDFVTAYVPNPCLNPDELKHFVAHEIGADLGDTNRREKLQSHELMAALYRKLIQLIRAGKQVVLVVDEAQAMPRETIECLRLLTNLETEKRKLLQVVILGQPELDTLLARRDLRQLNQRIIFSEYLLPFNVRGVSRYIDNRILKSRVDILENSDQSSIIPSSSIMTPFSKYLVYLGSKGIPRLINILCHKAFICAYGRGNRKVTAWHIAQAIFDTKEAHIVGRMYARCLSFASMAPKKEVWS